jgi:hypothetical protein
MPIFVRDKQAVLYIHVPRTGGSAIATFFRNNGFGLHYIDTDGPASLNRWRRSSPQHMHAEQINATLRLGQFAYIFMTVRNPLDRLFSEYKLRNAKLPTPETFPVWFDRMLHGHAQDPCFLDNHIRPQIDFRIPAAEVFHHEDGRPAMVEQITRKLGGAGLQVTAPDIVPENEAQAMTIPSTDIDRVDMIAHAFYMRDYTAFGY